MKSTRFNWFLGVGMAGLLTVQLAAKDNDSEDSTIAAPPTAEEILNAIDVTATDIVDAAQVLTELEAEALSDFFNVHVDIMLDPESIAPAMNYIFDTVVQSMSHFLDSIDAVLGIEFEPNDQDTLLVKSLHPESPLTHSGLRDGDILISVNGISAPKRRDENIIVTFPELMVNQIQQSAEPLVLEVSRNGETVSLEVPTRKDLWQDFVSSQSAFGTAQNFNSQLDLFFAQEVEQSSLVVMEIESDLGDYFDVEFGVLVLQAPDRSLLKPGDILLEIDDQNIRATSHVRKALRGPSDDVAIRVKRRSKNLQIQSDLSSMVVREQK